MTSDGHRATVGWGSATNLVIANMIGAGVFTTSGYTLAQLGSPARVLWAWVVGGGIAMCGAVGYGVLVRRITESGGEYLFLSRNVHPLAGFVAGWISLLAGFTSAIAFAATGLEAYLMPPEVRPTWLPEDTIAVAALLLCGGLHGARMQVGLVAQNWIVAVKLVLLATFAGWALTAFVTVGWVGMESPPSNRNIAPFSITAFAQSLVWISLSYSGFNAAAYIAGEAKDGARSVPRALLAGTFVVFCTYLLLNFIFVYTPHPDAIVGRPDVAAIAAQSFGGTGAAQLVRVAIGFALLSSVSSMILAGPRVYAKMADDGVLPRFLKADKTLPRGAIALQVLLAILVVLISDLRTLLSYLGFTLSLTAAATVASLYLMRAAPEREDRRVATVVLPLIYVAPRYCWRCSPHPAVVWH